MAVSLVPNGPSGSPFAPSQTPERLPERKGAGGRARVPQQVASSPVTIGNGWQGSADVGRMRGAADTKKKSRIVISQGECVIRKSTSFPAQKNLVGMIGTLSSRDSNSSSRSNSEEVMRKVVTSPSPAVTVPTQTSSSLAKALNDVALLHKNGKLSNDEYTEAKAVIINAEPPPSVSLGYIMDNSSNIDYQPTHPRRPPWDPSYSPRSPSSFYEDNEVPQSTYSAAYGGQSSHHSYREQLSKQEHKVAALMDENTGLRQVAEKLQYQLKLSGGGSPRGGSPTRTVSQSAFSGTPGAGKSPLSPKRAGVSSSTFAAAVTDTFGANPFAAASGKSSLPPTSPARPSFDPTAALRAASVSSPPAAFSSQPATPIQKTSKPQLRLPTRSPHRLTSPTAGGGEAEWSLNSLRSPR